MALTRIDPNNIDSLLTQGVCALLWTEKSGADVIKLAETLFEDASFRFPEIQFYVIDADVHVTLAESYGVRITPACLVFEDGGFMSEHIGPFSYDELNALLMNWHGPQLTANARAKSDPKQKSLWLLLIELASIEPNEHQTGDVFLDTQRFYDGLFAVLGHPDANATTLCDVEFKAIFKSLIAVASEIAVSNYKTNTQHLNMVDSVVHNNTAVILLRLHELAPGLLLRLLNAYNEKKAAGRLIKAITSHTEILESSVASMLGEYALGRKAEVHFKLPKSHSAIPSDRSLHYLEIFAEYFAGHNGMPTLTLRSLALVAAYMQHGLHDDLAKDPKAAALLKRAMKSPSTMLKAVRWVLERAYVKADEFKVKTIQTEQAFPKPLMVKQDEAFDPLRQTLDFNHMDYSMLNATTGHLELGYSTTDYHFSRYSPVLNTCISGLCHALQRNSPEFSQIKSVGIVLRHIDMLQIPAFAEAFRKLPSYKADVNTIREIPSIYYSAEILANNTPVQYVAIRAIIEFRPVGNSSKQKMPVLKMRPYDEQYLRNFKTMFRFSHVLRQIAQQLKDKDEQDIKLVDFLIKKYEMYSTFYNNFGLATQIPEIKDCDFSSSDMLKMIYNYSTLNKLKIASRKTAT